MRNTNSLLKDDIFPNQKNPTNKAQISKSPRTPQQPKQKQLKQRETEKKSFKTHQRNNPIKPKSHTPSPEMLKTTLYPPKF